MSNHKRIATALCLGGALVLTPTTANAATDWRAPDATYDLWNPDQYDPCLDIAGGNTDIDAVGPLHFTDDVPSIFRPAFCVDFGPMTMTNRLDVPVSVTYSGGWDTGSAADYLFEWVSGWSDITLEPGRSTPPFTVSVGMPWDAPDAARGVTGAFGYTWRVAVAEDQVTAPDLTQTITSGKTPAPFDPLAESAAPAGSTLAVDGDATVWSVAAGKAYAAVPRGFVGTLTTVYTVTTPGGQIVSGRLTLHVRAAFMALADLFRKTPYQTPLSVPLPPGLTVVSAQSGAARARVRVADGVLVYTPAPRFSGRDAVRLTGTNDDGQTVTWTVHVTVDEPMRRPRAQPPYPGTVPTTASPPSTRTAPGTARLAASGFAGTRAAGSAGGLVLLGSAACVASAAIRRRA